MQLSELTVRGFADLLGSDAPAPAAGLPRHWPGPWAQP